MHSGWLVSAARNMTVSGTFEMAVSQELAQLDQSAAFLVCEKEQKHNSLTAAINVG